MQTLKGQREYCNECGGVTNHLVIHHVSDSWHEDHDESICGGCTYSTVKCLGCDTISYVNEAWFSEDTDVDGTPITKKERFPPSMVRRHPDWFTDMLSLPADVQGLLKEIYIALQSGSLRLCALGTRALIEQMMIAKVGDNGGLAANIEAFLHGGYVAQREHTLFKEKIVEIGNAAMHRSYTPTAEDIYTLLDIIETLVAATYVHPGRAARMGQGMPPRRPRKK